MTQPDKLLVEQVFVAGNHLATSLLLIYDPCLIKTYDEALEKEGQPYADMWCAWRAIMDLALHNRSKHLETEGSGVQNAEAATMSKENVAHCNHYWKKIADTQYCEDCGIEFYQAQSTKTS